MILEVRTACRTQECAAKLEIGNFQQACDGTTTVSNGKKGFREICSGPILSVGEFSFSIRVVWVVDNDGYIRSDKDIGLYVQRKDESAVDCKLRIAFQIENRGSSRSITSKSTKYHVVAPGCGHGWSPSFPVAFGIDSLSMAKIFDTDEGWLHNGALRISCRLSIFMGIQNVVAPELVRKDACKDVCDSLLALLDAGRFVDVVLVVRGETIEAHSAILAARSPVFSAMLSAPMRESNEKRVVIDDLDAQSVRELLRFLYSGSVYEESLASDERALALLQAAHRYEVTPLVERCIWALAGRLTTDIVPERLELADLIQCEAFKAKCMEFMWQNMAEVQETPAYGRLVERRPSLLKELIASVVPPRAKRTRTGPSESATTSEA